MGGSEVVQLKPGANVGVASSSAAVTLGYLGSTAAVDGQALLVDATGRVRSDADFVFFNAPVHPSGSVRITADIGAGAQVLVDLPRLESAIDRVVLCVSSDTIVTAPETGFRAIIAQRGTAVAEFTHRWPTDVTALMVGEFYRRGDRWKFRAIGQGWASGLAGLATEFGVVIDDDNGSGSPEQEPHDATQQPLATPRPSLRSPVSTAPGGGPRPFVPPDWYPDQQDPGVLRWWDSQQWTAETRWIYADPARCNRCGEPLRKRRFGGGFTPCQACETQIGTYMDQWRSRAFQVLQNDGPRGLEWDRLWESIRFERIPDSVARDALTAVAMGYLEQLVAFAFADGEIEHDELMTFTAAVRDLQLPSTDQLAELERRMQRGRDMTRIRAGELPRIRPAGLHLDADELVYLDVPVNRIRYLANGAKYDAGQLIVSNKKIRFIGVTSGTELAWGKVVSVRAEYRNVVVGATTARGGAVFAVHDADYTAAILEGALRVAKRLVLTPGQRDSRSIPPHVRTEVWQRDGGQCRQCGAKEYLEFDHVIPHTHGGATSVENLQILCRNCNLAKGARL